MCQEGLDKYYQARKLFPSYKIDLNIGAALDALGRTVEAAVYHERFLKKSAEAPKEITERAKTKLEQLRKTLAGVTVEANVKGASILLNGEKVGQVPLAGAHYLKPGTYILTVESPGYFSSTRRLVLESGKRRAVTLNLVSRAALTRAMERWQQQEDRRQTRTLLAYSTLGVGIALAVGGGVLYGVGNKLGSDAHEIYESTDSSKELTRSKGDLDAAANLLVVGHVLTGLAVASLGVSIYSFLTRPQKEARPRTPGAGLELGFGASATGGGGVVSAFGRF